MVVTRQYGKPFQRYVSSVPAFEAPSDAIVQGSHDYLIDPVEGKLIRRGGSVLVGGSSGLLESGPTWSATTQARRVFSLTSPSLTDGYPTHAVLYDDYPAGNGTQIYFRSTNGAGTNQVIGEDYGATHYPADFKMVPWPQVGASTTTYNRSVNATQRAAMAQGSRNAVEIGDWLHWGGYGTMPMRWNKRFNDTTGAGTENLRVFPSGLIPPLFEMTFTGADGSATDGAWPKSQAFAYAVIFEMEDGSRSMPGPLPRFPGTGLFGAAGFGIKVVEAVSNFYQRMDITGIPVGPYGTKKRHIVASAQAASSRAVDILNLKYWFTIDDNTTTTASMSDFSLTDDTDLVRFDHIWQPPSKGMWVGDQRTWCGYTRQHPGGIILAPLVNVDDESLTGGGATYSYKLDGTNLSLKASAAGTASTGAGTGTYAYATYTTLQQLVDKVNSTTTASAGGAWRAQLVPGTSPNTPTSVLANTPVMTAGDADGTGDFSASGSLFIRAWSNAYPGIAYINAASLPTQTAFKRRVFFTAGGPGAPSLNGNQWVAGRSRPNYRTAPTTAGDFMMGGNTLNGQVVAFSKGIAVIRNKYGGGTGADEDYRLEMLNDNRGCISADSFVQMEGCVGYLTSQGFVVCDGTREIVISNDVWNPTTKTGDWGYEIQQCIRAASLDDERYARFKAFAKDGRIFCSYRTDNTHAIPNATLVYDYSAGLEAFGLAAFTNGDRTWPWSAPLWFASDVDSTMSVGAIGAVGKSDGWHFYGADDTPLSPPGAVLEIFTGSTDASASLSLNIVTNIDSGTETYVVSDPSDFSRVAEGALVSGNADIPAATTLVSKDPDSPSLGYLSANATAAAPSGLSTTFTSLVVQARGNLPMDFAETTRKKAALRMTAFHKSPNGGVSMEVSRNNLRSDAATLSLPVTAPAAPYSRTVKEIPLYKRSPAEVFAPAVLDNGSGVTATEFWGAEAELEVLNQQV